MQARLLAEHPDDDPDVLLARNRILGRLEPTRAFGDARYKVSRELYEQQLLVLLKDTYRSPPYVSAVPVITHHRISGTG